MDVESLNFKGNNPGAVKHGNFINYYQFHTPQDRLKVLPTDIWRRDGDDPLVCLDIGCNAGDLTACLHDRLSSAPNKCRMLAIDLDPTLIKRALEKHARSDVEFRCLNFTDGRSRNEALSVYLASSNRRKFDAVFCFSITMWIHLNEGDEGLRVFLLDVCGLGETIVIEPQPWKCYRAAVRRLKSSDEEFPNFKRLKVRADVEAKIAEIVSGQGFRLVAETERTEWGRKLLIFKKQ